MYDESFSGSGELITGLLCVLVDLKPVILQESFVSVLGHRDSDFFTTFTGVIVTGLIDTVLG